MSSWHSPQSIFNFGHKAIADLFKVEVQVQEKVDGSFFAFGWYPEDLDFPLKIRSKGAVMHPDAPMAMFKRAVDTVVTLHNRGLLRTGWQYRGEVLDKAKHNALAYDRVPNGHVILFDVLRGEEDYLNYEELKAEGDRLGLEVVPQLYRGMVSSPEQLRGLLDTVSCLGGQKIEGVVIKPISPFYGPDKKVLFAKFVSEAFREVHKQAWGESNPTTGDIISQIVKGLKTQARWDKAVIHLKERGLITGDSLRDIGPCMQEIPKDIEKECREEITEALWKFAWPHIKRQVASGFPEYYKQRLLEAQFEQEAQGDDSGLGNGGNVSGVGSAGDLAGVANALDVVG